METEIGSHESVRAAVIRAVCAVEGREPGSLPALSEVINPTALDELFDSQPGGEPRIGGRLSFIYSRCRIAIDNGEFLTIQPLESAAVPSSRSNSSPDPVQPEH